MPEGQPLLIAPTPFTDKLCKDIKSTYEFLQTTDQAWYNNLIQHQGLNLTSSNVPQDYFKYCSTEVAIPTQGPVTINDVVSQFNIVDHPKYRLAQEIRVGHPPNIKQGDYVFVTNNSTLFDVAQVLDVSTIQNGTIQVNYFESTVVELEKAVFSKTTRKEAISLNQVLLFGQGLLTKVRKIHKTVLKKIMKIVQAKTHVASQSAS